MLNPASLEDLVARRPLAAANPDGAWALIDQAWAILIAQSPGLPGRLERGEVDPLVVRSIVVAMVLRVFDNPQGYRQGSRTIDDFTESWTFDNATSTGMLYVTPQELALLAPAAVNRGAFTIRQVAGPSCLP